MSARDAFDALRTYVNLRGVSIGPSVQDWALYTVEWKTKGIGFAHCEDLETAIVVAMAVADGRRLPQTVNGKLCREPNGDIFYQAEAT